jgi:hypothetical protein
LMALAFLAKLILWSSCSFTIMWPLHLHIHLQHESTIIPAKPNKTIYLCSLHLLSCWHPFDLLALPSNSTPQLSMHRIIKPFYHHIPLHMITSPQDGSATYAMVLVILISPFFLSLLFEPSVPPPFLTCSLLILFSSNQALLPLCDTSTRTCVWTISQPYQSWFQRSTYISGVAACSYCCVVWYAQHIYSIYNNTAADSLNISMHRSVTEFSYMSSSIPQNKFPISIKQPTFLGKCIQQ